MIPRLNCDWRSQPGFPKNIFCEHFMTLDELVETFELLGPWEERYRFLIDMGRQLEPLQPEDYCEENKVRGCMSQVWMTVSRSSESRDRLVFRGDSDAHIVKGLIAILLTIYSEKTAEEIRQTDIHAAFERLGLESHISMNRRNGFFSMVERIQQEAASEL